MVNPIKQILLYDNPDFPIFTSPSKKVDDLTLGLFNSGILITGRNEILLSLDNLKSERERSHQFQLLSFQWLNRIIDCRGFEEGSTVLQRYWPTVLEPLILAIHRSESEPFFMAWNDHAYALRTVVLSKMFILSSNEFRDSIAEMLHECIHFLDNETNYDALSNHGWDQAKALLIASTLLGVNPNLGMQRFRDELMHAFSKEGVHVENSPHYHIHMLNNLIYSMELFVEIGVPASFIEEMMDTAKSTILYYQVVTRENGTIPLMGDSYNQPPNLNNITKKFIERNKNEIAQQDFFPFPETGYSYWKYKWNDHAVHFSLKNSHLSRYHRHDDDLSLTLNIGGVDVFLDGGLYKYEEKNEQRMFLRSPFSHSTIVLPDRNPQRKLGYEIKNSQEIGSKMFTAKSAMWEDCIVSRTVKMVSPNKFDVHDSVDSGAESFEILFQTNCQEIMMNGKNIILKFNEFSVSIEFSPDDGMIQTELKKSMYSPTYNELVESTTIVIMAQSKNLSYSISFKNQEVEQ
jgi:hypothetical protein